MEVTETSFPGLLVFEPKVFRDNRGFFLESYNRDAFREVGVDADFVQDNHAYSRDVGVLRGFHFQAPPFSQAKLVWVTRGAVLDVVVDLRKGAPSYGQVYSIELSAENFRRMFIPRGFAHAYLTLAPDTEFFYKVDAPYSPEHDSGLRFDDPGIGFDWKPFLKGRTPILSEKDTRLGLLANFDSPFTYLGE
ncbi:dTDP-4-dehydrorhamnose 3,5-epimerase [Salidesulfovibrio onnuriiensis]|uniref:dTDP-4-dehydrorhamnose 3,5-epimerase n=1 Tax=Salidesulfovibrio onnuriiensis TaxID=2583823 RepID=UPI0011C7E5E8|nr:dTDP-4-dehydrorhamnose 3,5-epimerase [Salidesulfovibrio onnuriiensis]